MNPKIKKLDDLAYAIVDKRSGGVYECKGCNATTHLSHHHAYGKGKAVRWETDRIFLICTYRAFSPKCDITHDEAEKDRRKFQRVYGNAKMYHLRNKIAYDIDYEAIEKELQEKLNSM